MIRDGIEARAGTISSEKERFMQWKTIDGGKPKKGLTEIEVLLRGMCNKQRFLDIVRNFIVFEKEKSTTKKLAAYHQYWATNKAVESIVKARKGDKKAGIVWHTQGSGKSFTVKILLNRLKNKFPDSYTYIIDPQGEYGSISEYLEMNHLNITKSGEQLGLDPFILLEPQDAADILGEITKTPATVKIQFQKYCDKAKNLEEFYYLLTPKSRRYLDHLLDGPLSRIFKKSDVIRINDTKRLIISMDAATGSDSEAMILVLLLNKIFKTCSVLPPSTRKIIVIDEAWMLFKMPGAAKYVDMIVRGGRKKNITFVFISQRIEDTQRMMLLVLAKS